MCCIQSIAIAELVCRATKHLFKFYMQGVDMMNLSAAMAHFLNCVLGSYPTPYAQAAAEEVRICPQGCLLQCSTPNNTVNKTRALCFVRIIVLFQHVWNNLDDSEYQIHHTKEKFRLVAKL